MNIKILSSLKNVANEQSTTITIGTHNGIFHSDEVLACAILCLTYSKTTIHILRSRDNEILQHCNICVDIGGGEFDHHQAGFNETRENGAKYASAGLIWKTFGRQLIDHFLTKYFLNSNCNIDYIFKSFDDSIIVPIDCEDNGVTVENHTFSFISSFLPLWFNNSTDDFNNQFHKVLMATITILEEELKSTIGREITKNTILNSWNDMNCFHNGILEIPSQTIEWVETVININNSTKTKKVDFVIFPYPDGGWAAQCVPPSLTNKFRQRIPFPKKWAGQTNKLPEITGIADATFCHNGCFFVRAKTKEAITKLCKIATNSAH